MALDTEGDVVIRQAGVAGDRGLEGALALRADVLAMTQAAHDAALTPAGPGGLSHAERAALAVRIARLNREEGLAAHYEGLLDASEADARTRAVADPSDRGEDGTRLAAIVAFCDLVSIRTPATAPGDIVALREAGVEDADIVRLAELVAFLAYQIRLVAGLRLMRSAA